MNFLAHFLRAWREAREAIAYESFADSAGGWTLQDNANLRSFFTSPTGARLGARLRNYVIRRAIDATKEHANPGYHAGLAQGAAVTVATLENHFARPPRSADKSEQEQPSSVADPFAINQ